MKIVCHAPFRIDPRGPVGEAIEHWQKKISPLCAFEIEYAPRKTLAEAEVETFYVKRLDRFLRGAVVALDEAGCDLDSQAFAGYVGSKEGQGSGVLHFCLGGAYGLPKSLASISSLKLVRLSSLTFSHELALAVLLEQIYRAKTILNGHPYHHGAASALAQVLKPDLRNQNLGKRSKS